MKSYCDVLATEAFAAMQAFSNEFLARRRSMLGFYRRHWVADPLRQWSRQWEYPYVFGALEEAMERTPGAVRVLDAGSGLTFFPFFLAARWERLRVQCCDRDPSLAPAYAAMNRQWPSRVDFQLEGIDHTSFSDGAFNAVYCISVMEHLEDYEAVVTEFARILKPGGALILTFDVSRDGEGDIPIDRAGGLLRAVADRFDMGGFDPRAALRDATLGDDAILTTAGAARIDRRLLPWRLYSPKRLRRLLTGRKPPFPDLTVFAVTGAKR